MLAREATIAVLDFESTGVVPGHPNEPWQLGMVRFEKGGLQASATYETLLRVGEDRPFNPKAPGNHHARRAEMAGAPTLGELWPELQSWWLDRPLAAHNVSVERKFVQEAAPMHRFGPWLDTLKLARLAYPDLESHALGDLLEVLRLTKRVDALCPGREVHDALYDAFACGVLLEYLLALPGWDGVSLEDLAGAHPEEYHDAVSRRTRRRASSPGF